MTATLHEKIAHARELTGRAFSRIFGVSPTSGMKRFFKDLGIIAISFVIARVLSAIASITAARMLGREEFGLSQLVITVAQLFSIFAIYGLNSSVIRFGVGRKDIHAVTSTAFWTVVAGIAGTIVLSVIFAGLVMRGFGITHNMYVLGVVCGIVYSLMMMVNSLQQTAGKFGLRGATEIAFSGVFLVAIILFVALGVRDYVGASWAYITAYGATALVGLAPIFWLVRPRQYNRKQLVEMVPYSTYNFVCGAGFFLMYSLQRPLLNRLLTDLNAPGESGADAVGIFSLYSTGSLNLAVFLGSMLSTVFFPRAAASANRQHLWKLSIRSWLLVTPALFVGLSLVQAVVVFLSGKEYPLDLGLILIFSFAACVITVQTNLGTLIGAEGDRGAKLGMTMSLTMGMTNLILSWLLIPIFKIAGAPLALAISYLIGILWLTTVRHNYLSNPSDSKTDSGKADL